ncbi:MAG TPA: hydroxymethylglutaryl-CoA synthase [Candidatus Thermoplasmatota archaeon]|nr:hydroxymethylglutaryl-CoA synthase [Candidatus Thermoplasmatota archaeon]
MPIGIVSYGAMIPRYRIKAVEIARVWGEDPTSITRGLGVLEKTVPGPDEDTTTLSVESARIAMRRGNVDPASVGAVYVGSESHVYAVKPTATILCSALGITPYTTAADFEFACKAGTAAMQACMGLVGSGMIRHGIAVGADTSQGAPGDALEYSASAGAAAFVVGGGEGAAADELCAVLHGTRSFTSDTPDFWRREGQKYPTHGGRFTGEPAYFRHVLAASERLLEETGRKPADYDHVVFHQPNGKFPVRIGQKLGFEERQWRTGLLTPIIGNTYSGSSMIGLAAVLDEARPGERVFVCAYGSGAGADAFDVEVTDGITRLRREGTPTLTDLIEDKEYVDYATYAKFRRKIVKGVSA